MSLFRIEPQLPPGAYQTYALMRPERTHSRVATCGEVDCGSHRSGWITNVDLGTELGRKQSWYIRTQSGRGFTMSQAGTMQTFEFPPGQQCFKQHRIQLDVEPLYVKVGGDWRSRTSAPVTMRPADWVEDFAEHQDKIITIQKKG